MVFSHFLRDCLAFRTHKETLNLMKTMTSGTNKFDEPFIISNSQSRDNREDYSLSTQLDKSKFAFSSFKGIGYKEINEDRVLGIPQLSLFAVIDGMGGPGDGGKASEIFAEELLEITTASFDEIMDIQEKVAARIQQECITAHSGICYVVFWIEGDILNIGHIGDVKLILLNSNFHIKFESRDHSLVNSWIDAGYISQDEALNHPQRHIITRALTGNEIPEIEIHQVPFNTGDRLVVGTDGLWDNFTIEEIISEIRNLSPDNSVNHLTRKSCLKMDQLHTDQWEGVQLPKPDNISILIGDLIPP